MPRSRRERSSRSSWADSSNWPRRLLQPTLAPGDLGRIVTEALLVRLPDHEVEATDEAAVVTAPSGNVLQARLGSIQATLESLPPEQRLRHFEPFLDALLETVGGLQSGVRKNSRDRLLPLVRDGRYFGAGDFGVSDACVDTFVAGLLVVYAWASPNAFDVVTAAERKALRLSPKKLRELAIRNLRRRMPPIERRRFGPIWAVATGGQLEPSVLLIDDLCHELAREVDGELIACVPSNQTLLFTGSEVEGGAEHLRRMAMRLGGAAAVSTPRALLRLRDGQWVEDLAGLALN